jgi:hypothetical protein
MDDILALLEYLTAFHNRAAALGIDLSQFTDDVSRFINALLDKTFTAEIAEIKNALRRPTTGSIN